MAEKLSFWSRLFGRAVPPAPAAKTPPPPPPPVDDWRPFAAFVADGVIRPMGRGMLHVEGLAAIPITNLMDYYLDVSPDGNIDGEAYEHPNRKFVVAQAKGYQQIRVLGRDLQGDPAAVLTDSDVAAFFPAGTTIDQIGRGGMGLTITARLPDTISVEGGQSRVVLSLMLAPFDPTWTAFVTSIRGAPAKA